MKERVRAAKMFKSLCQRRRSLCCFLVTGADDFLVCVHAFQNIFGLFVREWETLLSECRYEFFIGPILHGNAGNKSRHETSMSCFVKADVVPFQELLRDEKGELLCFFFFFFSFDPF